MNLRERFRRWRDFTAKTMSGMSFRQKLAYLLYYYKGWIFGLLLLVMLGAYIGDAVAQSQKEIILQGFFTNDEYGLFDAGEIKKEYTAVRGPEERQIIIFDDDLYIDLGGEATEYTAASNGKLIAYMAVQELDFVVTSGEVFLHYDGQAPMMDFRELLPEDMFEKLEDQLLGSGLEAGTGPCLALDMSRSRFGSGEGESYYMFVPLLAPHPQEVCDFIRWCFPEFF